MSDPATAAPRREYVAEAYEALRKLIVLGQLGPGVRLIETDLATRLGMSRTPLRTALYLLNQEGFVEAVGEGRQSRLTVAPITQEDAVEMFGIVGEIEGLAARRAAVLPATARAELASHLRELNGAMRKEAANRQPHSLESIRLDTDFHRALVEAGAGRRLLTFHRSVKPHADRVIHVYHTALTSELLVSTREHKVIIDCIASGDANGARKAVQLNWENATIRLSKSIAAMGERGVW